MTDAVPLDGRVRQSGLLGKRLLHVIFPEYALPEAKSRHDGVHRMQLGYRDQPYVLGRTPGSAGRTGQPLSHGFQPFAQNGSFRRFHM